MISLLSLQIACCPLLGLWPVSYDLICSLVPCCGIQNFLALGVS
jgi:hypothetical protein